MFDTKSGIHDYDALFIGLALQRETDSNMQKFLLRHLRRTNHCNQNDPDGHNNAIITVGLYKRGRKHPPLVKACLHCSVAAG